MLECRNCRWFYPHYYKEMEDERVREEWNSRPAVRDIPVRPGGLRGECRVGPPSIRPEPALIEHTLPPWPMVGYLDWCGRFEMGDNSRHAPADMQLLKPEDAGAPTAGEPPHAG